MSIFEDHNKIKEIAREIKVTPPDSAWSAIDSRLKSKALNDKKIKRKSFKSILSIAASLAVIFTCFSLIYFESQQVAELEKGKVEKWEELETYSEDFYSLDKVRELANSERYNP